MQESHQSFLAPKSFFTRKVCGVLFVCMCVTVCVCLCVCLYVWIILMQLEHRCLRVMKMRTGWRREVELVRSVL